MKVCAPAREVEGLNAFHALVGCTEWDGVLEGEACVLVLSYFIL
jgi:hypothetical protein